MECFVVKEYEGYLSLNTVAQVGGFATDREIQMEWERILPRLEVTVTRDKTKATKMHNRHAEALVSVLHRQYEAPLKGFYDAVSIHTHP